MLARVLAMALCPCLSVCPSQVGVLSKPVTCCIVFVIFVSNLIRATTLY